MDGDIILPRDQLARKLALLPAPDDDDAQPTQFFRRLLDAHQRPAIDSEALFADHQRLQHRLSDALANFHHHRACAGLEFCVVLAGQGPAHARPYMADIARWIAEIQRMTQPATSAVPVRGFGR